MGLPPRTTVKQVIVVVQPLEDDLKFRIIVSEWIGHACSPVITMENASDVWNGNPFGVYGDAIADYIGQSKYSVSISVARYSSGEI